MKTLTALVIVIASATSLTSCKISDPGCGADIECREGRICEQGICVDLAANNGNNNGANNGNNGANNGNNGNNGENNVVITNNGANNGDACPAGQLRARVNGVEGCWDICAGDDPCDPGFRCFSNICIPDTSTNNGDPGECFANDDCPLGSICADGFCSRTCSSNAECAEPDVCAWRDDDERRIGCVPGWECRGFGEIEEDFCFVQMECADPSFAPSFAECHVEDDGVTFCFCFNETGESYEFKVEERICGSPRLASILNRECHWRISDGAF